MIEKKSIAGNETTIYAIIQFMFMLVIIIVFLLVFFKGNYNYIKFLILLILSFILIFDIYTLKIHINVLLSMIFKYPENRVHYFKNLLFSFPQIKLIHNMSILKNINYPVVYLANYPSTFYEYLIPGFFPNSIIILDKYVKKFISPIVGSFNQYYLKRGNSFHTAEKDVVKLIGEGQSMFAYIEDYKESRIRSGLLYICKNNNIPIVLVIFDHFYIVKGIFPRQNFRIKVSKPTLIKDVNKTIKKIKYLYDKTLTFYKNHKLDFKYKQVINIK